MPVPKAALRTVAGIACATLVAVAPGARALSVSDGTGAQVELSHPAARIVSLAPHATEMLFAIGAGAQVVGVLPPADWPPEASRLPIVGRAGVLDLERIVALEPDLIIGWPFTAPAQSERLKSLGIALYISDPRTPDDIASDLERIGVLAGTVAAASRLAAALRARVAAFAERRAARPVRVFYEIWPDPLYTLGGRHLVSAALALCGGENVFASQLLPAPVVTVEAVLAADPDAIIAGTDGAARPPWLDRWTRWRSLAAVAQHNLWTVDANLLHRAGPRFADGLEQLCAVVEQARQRRDAARAASGSASR